MQYHVHAVDRRQQVVALTLEAVSEAAAGEMARLRGLTVFSVKPGRRAFPLKLRKARFSTMLFTVELALGAQRSAVLFERTLDPSAKQEDRGFQEFLLHLPQPARGTLVLRTSNEPGGNELADLSFWSDVVIR